MASLGTQREETGSEGLICRHVLTWFEVIWSWVKYSVCWKLYWQRHLSTSPIKDYCYQCLPVLEYCQKALDRDSGWGETFIGRFGMLCATVSSEGLLEVVSNQIMMEQHRPLFWGCCFLAEDYLANNRPVLICAGKALQEPPTAGGLLP